MIKRIEFSSYCILLDNLRTVHYPCVHSSKRQFAEALGKRPNEITRWLSGEHNFTISTLAMLTAFFNQPIITVS